MAYKEIQIENKKGSCEGYETSVKEENFFNYLDDHMTFDELEAIKEWMIAEKFTEFTVLKNIWIDEEFRNQGIGNEMMSDFLDRSDYPVFLLCDNGEDQQVGFDLEKWYNSFGFERTPFNTPAGPILVLHR